MRYGSIRYVNNLPVDLGLMTGQVDRPDGLDIVEGEPTRLNRHLADGTVDVAAVSAATLLAAPGVRLLPEATIASHGPVESVLLLSKVPFGALDGRVVAVTDESATGATLLRILLERDLGITPEYRTMPSDLTTMLAEADAALLIGDDALRATGGPGGDHPDGLHVLDLGEAWRAYTGLPMVYAVWAARDAYAGSDAPGLAALRAALVASRDWARDHMDTVLDEAARRTDVPRARLATYYSRLSYALGPAEREGLARFLEEARALDPTRAGDDAPVAMPTIEVMS